MLVQTLYVNLMDGRKQVGWPDAVMVRVNEWTDPLWIDGSTWDELTCDTPIFAGGRRLKLTVELYEALKSRAIPKPKPTSNTVASTSSDPQVCSRCGGLGRIDAYKHINGGICFECDGSGKKGN